MCPGLVSSYKREEPLTICLLWYRSNVSLDTQNSLQAVLNETTAKFESLSLELDYSLRDVNCGVQNVADTLDGIRLGETLPRH